MTDLNTLTNEELKTLFQKKSEEIKKIKEVSNEDKLILYKYYKQATIGNINIEKPGFLDFTGRAKYKAWEEVKDMTKDLCMKKYIQKVNELLTK